ncbi:MAG: hypothetical protein RL011_2491 [Pseudomonadota bacterium]|jgi:drug/metabolite transporter (DMT)-like permease
MSTFAQVQPAFRGLGEVASIAAAVIWSVSITMYAKYGKHVDNILLNVNKNVVAGVCLVLTALFFQIPIPSSASQLPILGLSGVIGIALGDTLFFFGLMHIGANLVSALQCLAPLIAAILALIFLGESMTQLELVGMIFTVVAVTGVVLFHKKDGVGGSSISRKDYTLGIIYSLASAVCHGIGIVMSRQALQEIDIVYGTVARIAPAVIALAVWQYRAKSRSDSQVSIWATKKQGLLLTAAAFLGTYLGLILMSLSTKYTKAGVGTALSSTYPIWVIPVARLMTNERSSLISIICTVFAVLGIVIMVLGGTQVGFE